MLRQQRSQRQPSRFQDFVDLPPQKRIRRSGEIPPAQRTAHRHQKATGCHSSSPNRPTARPTTTAEKRAIAPKVVQHSEQDVHEIATTDFFLQSAAAGGVVVEYVCPVVEYVCPEELLALSAAERIDFLQDKLHRIRTYYASLKSEVESIDRRCKRMKRKKRRRDGSTTPASASVSSGSSPSMDTASSPSTDTLII